MCEIPNINLFKGGTSENATPMHGDGDVNATPFGHNPTPAGSTHQQPLNTPGQSSYMMV